MKIAIRPFVFLIFLVPWVHLQAELSVGQTLPLQFVDVDGNTLSTADGHVTVLVVATRDNLPRAEQVGERVPDFCLGNPTYRMITLVKFGKHSAPVRSLLIKLARRHLDADAAKLQERYDRNKIEKKARDDVFAVADFDGSVSSHLESESSDFYVFIFGRNGELIKRWNEVPDTGELADALK